MGERKVGRISPEESPMFTLVRGGDLHPPEPLGPKDLLERGGPLVKGTFEA